MQRKIIQDQNDGLINSNNLTHQTNNNNQTNSESNNQTNSNSLPLPNELIFSIFTHLNKAELPKTALICKDWNTIIKENMNSKIRLESYISDYLDACKNSSNDQKLNPDHTQSKKRIETLASQLASFHIKELKDYSSETYKIEYYYTSDDDSENENDNSKRNMINKEKTLRDCELAKFFSRISTVFLLIYEANKKIINEYKLPPQYIITPSLDEVYFSTDLSDENRPIGPHDRYLHFDHWKIKNSKFDADVTNCSWNETILSNVVFDGDHCKYLLNQLAHAKEHHKVVFQTEEGHLEENSKGKTFSFNNEIQHLLLARYKDSHFRKSLLKVENLNLKDKYRQIKNELNDLKRKLEEKDENVEHISKKPR